MTSKMRAKKKIDWLFLLLFVCFYFVLFVNLIMFIQILPCGFLVSEI